MREAYAALQRQMEAARREAEAHERIEEEAPPPPRFLKVRTGLFSGPTGQQQPKQGEEAPLWERRHPEPPPQPPSTQQPTPPQSPPPKSPPPNAPTQQSSSRQEEAPKEPPQEEAQRPQWGGPETAVCGPFVSQNVHTAVRNGMIWHHQVIHITWASGPAPSEAQEERKVWEEEPAPRSNARDPRQHRRQAEAMRAEETASEEREPAAAKAPAATATEAPTAAATEGAAATEEAAAPATATATEIPTAAMEVPAATVTGSDGDGGTGSDGDGGTGSASNDDGDGGTGSEHGKREVGARSVGVALTCERQA
ncbi:proline-rich receptor-like protein kinase PERK8 [Drosophila obscura]|uniref:proline-rich receptor-like protein kinase PERK8 n=1 Tax=Drosophila obscura TaxID=7282 RepID=UPI001BB1F522|nr:proline-rich receptor-like protein kinase PERK8 [Drosophila obscura]